MHRVSLSHALVWRFDCNGSGHLRLLVFGQYDVFSMDLRWLKQLTFLRHSVSLKVILHTS